MHKEKNSPFRAFIMKCLLCICFAAFIALNQEAVITYTIAEVMLPLDTLSNSNASLYKTMNHNETPITVLYAESTAEQTTAQTETIKEYDIENIIGLTNVIFEDDSKTTIITPFTEKITKADIDNLQSFEYLKKSLYSIDKRTDLLASDINVNEFIDKDLTITKEANKPKVLIFHTHSQEGYKDSVNPLQDGVFMVGDILAKTLKEQYNIETLHHKGTYDVVNGKSQITGAYDRANEAVSEILKQNPSIEIVIDLHRDGVPDSTRLVTTIDDKPTAQIMFVNGLSRIYEENELKSIDYLQNPYTTQNLMFSFQAQLMANELYPGLARKTYINAFRYSLAHKEKSLLLEVGAQNSTIEEAKNAVIYFANVLDKVVSKQ